METNTTTLPTGAKPTALKANQVFITGRIDSVRTYDSQGRRHFEHRVILPAVDQYTQPSYVLVQAGMRLGSPGEDLKSHCQISGYRNSFKTKDGEFIESARMLLRAVD